MTRPAEAVPASLRVLLHTLAAAGVTREFYLAGGTGLALLLNHRRSVDLDFFSRINRLDFQGRAALQSRLKRFPGWSVIEAKDGTLHGRVGPVRVSFFWYEVPLLKPFHRVGSVRVASLEDIGVMKLGAIIGRGSRKDFVDLYAICQRIPLSRLLTLGRRKFKDSRDFTLQALKALSYFQDAERDPPIVTVAPLPWHRIKALFTSQVHILSRRYL